MYSMNKQQCGEEEEWSAMKYEVRIMSFFVFTFGNIFCYSRVNIIIVFLRCMSDTKLRSLTLCYDVYIPVLFCSWMRRLIPFLGECTKYKSIV